MFSKYLFIHIVCSISVNGDLLQDYVQNRVKDLPNWLQNNTANEVVVSEDERTSYADTFIRFNLQPFNYLAKGLNSLQMSSQPEVSATTRIPSLSIIASARMDLELVGNYEVDGLLFPDFEAIPFKSSGYWSTNVICVITESYRANIKVGMDGTMNSTFKKINTWGSSMGWYNFEVFNFLPEHKNQWYFEQSLIKLENEIKSGQFRSLPEITLFQKYFDDTFQQMNYFDFLGPQKAENGTIFSMSK